MRILLLGLIISQFSFAYHHHHRSNKHHHKGYRHSKLFVQAAKKKTFKDIQVVIPNSVSLIGKISPIENQQDCGSCYIFSNISTLRDTLILTGIGDPGRLSFNYLLNCDKDQGACNGGSFSVSDYLIAPNGPPLYGTDGEYIAKRGVCVREPVAASAVSFNMLNPLNGKVAFRDVAYTLSQLNRPLVTTVAAANNWQEYESGVMTDCSPQETDHMVAIVAYDCEGPCNFDANGNLPAGVGTYMVRNSWGTDYGMQGFITTKATDTYGNACSQIAQNAGYYTVTGK